MFNAFGVSHVVLEDEKFIKLSLGAKYLYVYLSKLSNKYANIDGWFWHSNREIAKGMRVDIKSVINNKKLLYEAGFINYRVITYSQDCLKSTEYRITHFEDIKKY